MRRGFNFQCRQATQYVRRRANDDGDSRRECEIPFPKPAWLRQESVVNVLGIAGVDNAKIERRLAAFPADKMLEIEVVLKRMLGI